MSKFGQAEIGLKLNNFPIVKITKIKDTKFDGNHPNEINEGYTKQGILYNPPKVGESVRVGSLLTSTVTEIINNDLFKTENSVYKIEYLS